MSKNTYPLKLPTSVKKAAAELAASDGVSLNQFIAAAVAEKAGSWQALAHKLTPSSRYDHVRAHHFVVFVLQHVAMPHVAPHESFELHDDARDRQRIDADCISPT